MDHADVSAPLKTHLLSLNRCFEAGVQCVWKARACKGIVVLTCFLVTAVSADTVLRASDHLSAFNDFLARDAVNARRLDALGDSPKVHYELRQGTKLENGCRFRWKTSSHKKGVRRVEHVIAQDMDRCERLFLIGAPQSNPGHDTDAVGTKP